MTILVYSKKKGGGGGWAGRYVVMNKTWVFVGILLQDRVK